MTFLHHLQWSYAGWFYEVKGQEERRFCRGEGIESPDEAAFDRKHSSCICGTQPTCTWKEQELGMGICKSNESFQCDPCLSLLETTSFSPAIEVDVDFFVNDSSVNCFAFVGMGSGVYRKPLLSVYGKIEIIGWMKMHVVFSGGGVVVAHK
ncbi:hypothetical protein HAX54_002369 [Datura stramonium]|uniref:Uncharacterized protein n=1 Tax=Datura stramonium TaxID=4076 RepID=A0ABS8WV95_DATST|nr:hypothetical protein [Datura stramonium]